MAFLSLSLSFLINGTCLSSASPSFLPSSLANSTPWNQRPQRPRLFLDVSITRDYNEAKVEARDRSLLGQRGNFWDLLDRVGHDSILRCLLHQPPVVVEWPLGLGRLLARRRSASRQGAVAAARGHHEAVVFVGAVSGGVGRRRRHR